MIFGGFFFFILLIYFISYTPYRRTCGVNFHANQSPLEILNTRFVNGEIDETEYLSKKKLLENK